MPQVNRYTQMPAPSIVNPISFEEFAKVPMAKAMLAGETTGAIDRIKTDYNVDDADLGYISSLVEGIDKKKGAVVDDITNNNINSQTIADVLKLKKERDTLYKTKIQQAEENKRRVDLWKQQIDQMYGKDAPWYAAKIKEKELADWKLHGSFKEGDVPRTFAAGMGETYYSIKDDVFKFMEQAKEMTQSDEKGSNLYYPGGTSQVQKGDMVYDYTTNTYRKSTMTNEPKLAEVYQSLLNEYNDPDTERGRFAKYADIDLETIKYNLDQAFNAYRRTQVDEQGGGSGYSNARQLQTTPNENEFELTLDEQEVPLRNLEGIETTSTGILDNISKTVALSNKATYKYTETSPEDPSFGWMGLSYLAPLLGGVGNYLTKGFKYGSWDSKNLHPNTVYTKEVTKNLFNSAKVVTGGTNKKLALLEAYPDVINTIVGDNQKMKDLAYNALTMRGKNSVDILFDKVDTYLHENMSNRASPLAVGRDYRETEYGQDVKGVKAIEAAKDVFASSKNAIDESNRDYLDKEDQDVLNGEVAAGELEQEGNLTILSIGNLDKRGIYIEGSTGAHILKYNKKEKKGKRIFVPLSKQEKNTPEYVRAEELNRDILNLAKGGVTQKWLNVGTPDKAVWKQVFVRRQATKGDELNFTILDNLKQLKEKTLGIKLTPKLTSRLAGNDYYTNYILNE